MGQRPTFNLNRPSTASRILLFGGLLYFIDLFFPWNKLCIAGHCGPSLNGWHGIGILNGILVILILVMEILMLADVEVTIGTPVSRALVETGLAGGLLLFTIIRMIIRPSGFLVFHYSVAWGAWLGLVLAIVVAYGGYMRWQEAMVTTPPPPSAGGFAP